ncbi:MAG: hypothetical protein H6727_03515 [Myxococcales bacterium]|nr:hypothetical protein [Myxococcales bacterium]
MSKHWKISLFVFVVLGASAGLVACGGGTTPAECGETGVSFSKCVQPIFAASCSGSFCHGTDNPSLQLTLTQGGPANIVGVDSKQNAGSKLVVASDAANSYLYQKVSQDKPAVGARMPTGKTLSAADLKLIETWIAEGAKDN